MTEAEQLIGNIVYHALNISHSQVSREFDTGCARCQIFAKQVNNLLNTTRQAARREVWLEAAKVAEGHRIDHRDSQRDGGRLLDNANHSEPCDIFLAAKFCRRAQQENGG